MNEFAHLPPPPAPQPSLPPKREPMSRGGWAFVLGCPFILGAILLFAVGLPDTSREPKTECGLACEGGPMGLLIGMFLITAGPFVLLTIVALVVSSGVKRSKHEGTWPHGDANDRGPSGR